jgi:hypothetical protein
VIEIPDEEADSPGSPVLPGLNGNAMDGTNSGTASAALPACSCLFFRFLKGLLRSPRVKLGG